MERERAKQREKPNLLERAIGTETPISEERAKGVKSSRDAE